MLCSDVLLFNPTGDLDIMYNCSALLNYRILPLLKIITLMVLTKVHFFFKSLNKI